MRDAGSANRYVLAAEAHTRSDEVVGGISGYMAWGWFYLN